MTLQKRFDHTLMKSLFALTLALIGAVLFSSCAGNGCEENREAYCVAEFRGVSGATLSRMSVWGIGQGLATGSSDSLMYSGAPAANIEWMLDPDTTSTRLRILFTGVVDREQVQVIDTLTFTYKAEPYFLNMECGCSVFYQLEELTSTNHFIYDARIVRREITNEENIHLLIEY